MPQRTDTTPTDIRLICGLGNPGADYERTRHNAGFLTIDAIARRERVSYWRREVGCLTCRLRHKGSDGTLREVVLAKPQGYMNTSGGPLSKLMRELGLAPTQILVVHDEVDLSAGTVSVKLGGGLNAHNGLRSIANKLGTRDFARVRVGTGRPPGRMSVADFALRQLKGNFLTDFELTCESAADVCISILKRGLPRQA